MPTLRQHPGFKRLWVGQSVSVFGSVVGIAAMGFTAILFLGATPFQLGILNCARLIPGFLAGLPAGAWVDKFRRRPILIGADVGRALLLATIPLAAMFHALRIGQLYAVTFLVSILTVFFDIAYQSYLPTLIPAEDLVEGNSKLSASAAVAEAGGFSIAGWLVQRFTAPITILIDALSFVVSAISVCMIDAPEPRPENEKPLIIEGLKAVWNHPVLRAFAACNLSKDFFLNVCGPLMLLYMTRNLGFAPGILGVIFAVGGVSSFVGAMVTQSVTKRLGGSRAMIAGLLVFGLSLLCIPLARGATALSATLLVTQQLAGDGAMTMYRINEVSIRQFITPARLLGRVNASSEVLRLGASLAGSLAAGVLGEVIGVRATLFCGTAGVIFSAVVLLTLMGWADTASTTSQAVKP